jgi:hypothetical protein
MIVAIHQPNYLPWLGYFYKIAKCDIFLILDTVQYEKNGPTNRVKIKIPNGDAWLSLPIKRKFPQLIKDVELVNYFEERKRHIKTIESCYKKAKYFNYLFPGLEKILNKDWKYLADLNIELIKFLKNEMGIKTRVEIASNYNVAGKSTDLLINFCKIFNADTYLSGKGGEKYQEEVKFREEGIELKYTDFVHLTYSQLWGNFIPGLSVIDLIFNYGPKSFDFLLKSNK